MQNSQHCINCLLPDTRNTMHRPTLRGEETTHMNSSRLLSLQLVSMFLCQLVPLQFYLIYAFYFIILELIYNQCPYNVYSCSLYLHIFVYHLDLVSNSCLTFITISDCYTFKWIIIVCVHVCFSQVVYIASL